ncbi:MAG: hypothetical protein FJ109_21845, partial [Deltaproteobacteria bacterium]|nr:hypothetical protein [Deltaproteobacteria bacterium]
MRQSLFGVVVAAVAFFGCSGGQGTPDADATFYLELMPADICKPECDGKECGPDGCGGECGTCEGEGAVCSDQGTCCVPSCDGKECGPDGCGGECGACEGEGAVCLEDGTCCNPNCDGKGCGPDGCGGECGTCQGGDCDLETGICIPPPLADCTGKECGSDGAGGSCGACPCDTCDAGETICNPETFQCQADLKDCPWIFDCFDTCPEGDQACLQNCVNGADMSAGVAYNNLIQCLTGSGYFQCAETFEEGSKELEACLEETFAPCQDYYYECFHGDLDCQQLNDCFGACPQVPEGQPNPCVSDCWANGTVKAQKTYAAIIECLEKNGYWDCAQGDQKCLSEAEAACQAELDACFPPGTATCKEIVDCFGTCASTDE